MGLNIKEGQEKKSCWIRILAEAFCEKDHTTVSDLSHPMLDPSCA